MPGPANTFGDLGNNVAGLYHLHGSFVVNGASAPVGISGKGFTIGAPSTGAYTITLDNDVLTGGPFGGVFAVKCGVFNIGTNSTVRVNAGGGGLVTGASKSFIIRTQSSAGVDANLSSNEVVWFEIVQLPASR